MFDISGVGYRYAHVCFPEWEIRQLLLLQLFMVNIIPGTALTKQQQLCTAIQMAWAAADVWHGR